jgi:glycogen synthase
MKICHLIYDDVGNPWLGGGGAVRAREIYRRLAERHEVTLVTGRFPGAAAEEWSDGLHFVRVGSERSYARSRLGYCREAVRCLDRLEWDIWVHDFSAFAPLLVPARLRRFGLLSFYHFVGHHALRKHPLVGGFAWAAEGLTLRGYSRIITISPSVREEVERRLRGRSVQIDCVYTGVDGRYFELEPIEEPFLLYFGRPDVHTKGLDVLLDGFASIASDYPEVTLKMAGRGAPQQVEHLRRLVAGAGLGDRVEMLGGVDEEEKGELLRRALFVCMPSRYEGWGIVAVEAAAAGKAVVGTRISGLVDAVRDGETGLLASSGDAEGLAERMRRLLDDGRERKMLGENGRRWARRFDWDSLAQDQEEVYCRALAERE